MAIVGILLWLLGFVLAWMGGDIMHNYWWQTPRKDRKTQDIALGAVIFLSGGGFITLAKWIYS